jgi:uncharacterized glyoxalase superfamily protein PhnB
MSDIIPVLACSDIVAEHDFLVNVCGFASGGVDRTPGGMVVHGEVRLGERRIWLHRETPGLAAPRGSGAAGGGLVVQVDDVDAHCARARAAGATITTEPADQPYGQREYELKDPDGHSWWFATATAAPAKAESRKE